MVNAQTVRNAWYRARKSVPRLEEKKVSLYNLRHRAISHMKAYTNSDKTVMEFAGHERLDTDRHYQHAVETERRRIISGMENDAKDAIPSVSGNDVPVPRNAGGTSVEIARLLERTDVVAISPGNRPNVTESDRKGQKGTKQWQTYTRWTRFIGRWRSPSL